MPCCHNSLCKMLACVLPWLTGLDTLWSSSGLTADTNAPCTSLCEGSQWRLKGIHLPWHTNTATDTCWAQPPLKLVPSTIIQVCWFHAVFMGFSAGCSVWSGLNREDFTLAIQSQVWHRQLVCPSVLFKTLWGRHNIVASLHTECFYETEMPKLLLQKWPNKMVTGQSWPTI